MPFLYRMIRGAVGKEFVIKHYKGGKIVRTRFPDMSGIVATEKQKVRRNLFREAVVWAKWVIGDEERKLAFRNTLPRKKRRKVYQAALQMYMREKGNKQWLNKQLAICNGHTAPANVDVRKLLLVCNGWLGIEGKDARKQLAVMAAVESRRVEVVEGIGGYELMDSWRVLWQKKVEKKTCKIYVNDTA